MRPRPEQIVIEADDHVAVVEPIVRRRPRGQTPAVIASSCRAAPTGSKRCQRIFGNCLRQLLQSAASVSATWSRR